MIDFLGHVAYFFILLGTYLISKKKVYGWVVKIIGDIIWLILGIYLGLSSIWVWEFGFIITALYAIKSWNKE